MSSPLIPRLTDWHGAAQVHPYFVCDVFTAQPLQGNQLGVFVDGRPITTEQMQSLAREMNFAETVFLLPPREGGDVWIRIFSSESELPFAGHPVLGTAFVVSTALGKENVALETGAGLVPGRIGFGQEIEIRQGAEIGRPSVLYAVATGARERVESVEVGGVALIVAEGVFRIAQS